METNSLEIIRLELKYCERCGGLWMRTQDSGDVYCPACVTHVLDLPGSRARTKARLPSNDLPGNDRIEIKSQCDDWTALASQRGDA